MTRHLGNVCLYILMISVVHFCLTDIQHDTLIYTREQEQEQGILDQLSHEQTEEFRAAFDLFDKDGNGSISKEELGFVMKNLGLGPSDEDLRDIIREHDIDQSGQIEFEEFCKLMLEQVNCQGEDRDETLLAAFKTFDRDGSGKISADELRQMMQTLGERLTDDEIEDMIREADIDGDGQIDYIEFVQMMESKN